MTEEQANTQNASDWIKFLEGQVAERNQEIEVLVDDLAEKEASIKDLRHQHEVDRSQLMEMTSTLNTASKVIEELRLAKEIIQKDLSDLKEKILLHNEELKAAALADRRRERVRLVLALMGGFVIGAIPTIVLVLRPDIVSSTSSVPSSTLPPISSLTSASNSQASADTNVPPSASASATPITKLETGKVQSMSAKNLGETKSTVVTATPAAISATQTSSDTNSSNNARTNKNKNSLHNNNINHTSSAEEELEIDDGFPVVLPDAMSSGRIPRETWRTVLHSFTRAFISEKSTKKWVFSPEFRSETRPVVITRGQFRDVVSRRPATTLPSRTRNGLLLYSFVPSDVDEAIFVREASDDNIPIVQLCQAQDGDLANIKRLSIVLSGDLETLDCLERLISASIPKQGLEEITLVSITRDPRLAASLVADGKLLTFQEWSPIWLQQINPEDSDRKLSYSRQTARMLARLARILTKSSDVQVQIPLSLRKNSASHVNNRIDNSEDMLVAGNLILLPSSLPIGPIRAMRLAANSKSSGRVIEQLLASKTKALIINGSENNLSFEMDRF